MRKVKLYVGKSSEEIERKVLALKDRLIHEARVDTKKLSRGITRFSSLENSKGREADRLLNRLSKIDLKITEQKAALDKLHVKRNTLRTKTYLCQDKQTQYKNKVCGMEVKRGHLGRLGEVLFVSNESLVATSAGLKRSEGFLNPEFPVEIGKYCVSFITKELHIYDTTGEPLPFTFGPYKVNLSLDLNGFGGTDLTVKTLPSRPGGGWYDARSWSDNNSNPPHPHISTDLRPCLGKTMVAGQSRDIAQYIKNYLLPEYRIAEILAIFEEFFRTYTSNDAYAKLSRFVGTNRWDNPERYCLRCDKIRQRYVTTVSPTPRELCSPNTPPKEVQACSCITCKTGALVESKDELAPCGFTWNVCLVSCRNCHQQHKLG